MVLISHGRQQWDIAHVTPPPPAVKVLGLAADPEVGEAERGYGVSKSDRN